MEFIRIRLKLHWIYADDSEKHSAEHHVQKDGQLSEEPLIPPPQEELMALYNIARSGLLTKLRGRLDTIEAIDPQFIPFARKIRQFLKGFRMEEIQEFIQQNMEEQQ